MTILVKLKELQLKARKEKDPKAPFLTYLLSEIVNVGKNSGNRETTDAESIKIIKSMIKKTNENIEFLVSHQASTFKNHDVEIDQAKLELEVLESLLPKQLSRDELTHEINNLIAYGLKTTGEIMRQLKIKFDGRYDGGLASMIIKEKLS